MTVGNVLGISDKHGISLSPKYVMFTGSVLSDVSYCIIILSSYNMTTLVASNPQHRCSTSLIDKISSAYSVFVGRHSVILPVYKFSFK